MAEILDISRIEECDKSARYVDRHGEELRMLAEEVKRFYASLFMLRSRCIDSDDGRLSSVPGSMTKEEHSMSDVEHQITVYLRHDQYEALGEILTELPNAMDKYRGQVKVNRNNYIAQFPGIPLHANAIPLPLGPAKGVYRTIGC